MPLKARTEDVEAKYDVTLNYPNLELHSAAASGNVGLVHYALTHGQPVNSVLHGVLPIHAACSGGSVSVVKMLIERGADVNAPRLPRRYSDGKKSNAPSIGTAGSTPLHFAAANGHSAVVQILLTCGAIPDKSDKNGMTPEALAEVNGHTDVIRVLRVWEHLRATDPTMSVADESSYQASEIDEDDARYASLSSRKGKERAFSFASNVSDSTTGHAVKLRQSLEGLFTRGRGSRANSVVSSRLEISSPVLDSDRLSVSEAPEQSIKGEPSPETHPTVFEEDAEQEAAQPLDRVVSSASGSSQPPPLVRVTSEQSEENEDITTSPRKSVSGGLGPAPSRHNPSTSGSSRRPSLPSIFEKAAHPGAAFRAALRREHKEHQTDPQTPRPSTISPTTPTFEDFTPTSADSSHSHGLFRGRRDSTKSKHGHNKYMSKHALLQLFKRSHSPPSRSPSPPRRSGTKSKPPDTEQIEEGIEKMRRASLDLDLRQSSSIGSDDVDVPRMPVSAPPTKTTFFVDSIIPPIIPPMDPALIPLPPTPPRAPSVRRARSRQASDVISPSPLSNEWATSSDSDTPRSLGMIRRSKTDVTRSSTPDLPLALPRPALQGYRSNPPSPLRNPATSRSRAVTSPSTPTSPVTRTASGTKLAGMAWGEPVDLRKVASLRQESRHRISRRYTHGEIEALRNLSVSDSSIHDEPSEVGDERTEVGSEVRTELETTPTKAAGGDEEGKASAGQDEVEMSTEESIPSLTVEVADLSPEPQPGQNTSRQQGRYRGASIGSMSGTTESSRISTPPGSSLRMSLVTSDEEPKSPKYASYTYDAKTMPPPGRPSSESGRARGKSVSSTSSIPSDVSLSYFNASTPGTSLTPQSALSVARFPPVPEHEVAHHPVNRRKVSNRAEAREAKQQAEEDVLQLAQMPVSLDSSRSLAAQLAAYGESVAVERKFAARERMDGSEMSYSESGVSGKSARSESVSLKSGSDGESWFSARSGEEGSGDNLSSTRSKSRQRRKAVPPMADVPPELLRPSAPKSSLSSINTIYDKRAAAYRDRMAALTALPPSFPSSLSSTGRGRGRTASNESGLTGGGDPALRQPAWLTGQSDVTRGHVGGASTAAPSFITASESVHPPRSKKHPSARSFSGGSMSTSMVTAHTTPLAPSSARTKSLAMSSLGTASQALQRAHSPGRTSTRKSATTTAPSPAPPPIADVISTRYAGMSPPPHVPQPPRLDPSSPYVSIFSHRYSGQPHDGDDSDDEEQPRTGLTVVENEGFGRFGAGAGGGGLGGAGAVPDDAFERKGRWGAFKGAMRGKVGGKKG